MPSQFLQRWMHLGFCNPWGNDDTSSEAPLAHKMFEVPQRLRLSSDDASTYTDGDEGVDQDDCSEKVDVKSLQSMEETPESDEVSLAQKCPSSNRGDLLIFWQLLAMIPTAIIIFKPELLTDLANSVGEYLS